MPLPKDPIKLAELLKRQSETRKRMCIENPEYHAHLITIARRSASDRELQLKKSVELKKFYEDNPEVKEKLAEMGRNVWKNNPDLVAKQSALAKERWKNPEYREHMSAISKKRWSDPKLRLKSSESHKKMWNNPEYRSKRWWERKELREKHSVIAKELHNNSSYREKHLIAVRRRFVDSQWYGSVKYYDGPQYCEKWTYELRERVRAYFGYTCVECGKTQEQNGKKLSVHHVWYNKQTCCDSSPRSLVPLCKSCHMKSNNNREYWSRYFQDIIDTEYNGKCWFTREEMIEFLKNSNKDCNQT